MLVLRSGVMWRGMRVLNEDGDEEEEGDQTYIFWFQISMNNLREDKVSHVTEQRNTRAYSHLNYEGILRLPRLVSP